MGEKEKKVKGSEMGRDPAISWFFNDWHGGTMTLSRFLKGCYMDLMTAQFNNGHLSLDEIKTVLGSDFGSSWPTLQKKFKKDANDLLYNDRLEFEIKKRKNYSKGRRKNLEPINDCDFSPHMGNGIGKGNEIIIKKVSEENISELRTDVLFQEKSCMALSISLKKMNELLEDFIKQKMVGDELEKPYNDCRSHFVNWAKIEIKKETKNGKITIDKPRDGFNVVTVDKAIDALVASKQADRDRLLQAPVKPDPQAGS